MTIRAHAVALLLILAVRGLSAQDVNILLLAGTMQPIDHVGHHDYQGGILVLHDCLVQTPGVHVTMSKSGWPADEHELEHAQSVVFYCDGGGKQPYLKNPERIAAIDALVARGVGLVLIHQAIDHPAEHVSRAIRWMGGSYDPAVSSRGHWASSHSEFPAHALTSGVTPWSINDGWLCDLRRGCKASPPSCGRARAPKVAPRQETAPSPAGDMSGRLADAPSPSPAWTGTMPGSVPACVNW